MMRAGEIGEPVRTEPWSVPLPEPLRVPVPDEPEPERAPVPETKPVRVPV